MDRLMECMGQGGWWRRLAARSTLGAVVAVSVGAGVLGAAREAAASVPPAVPAATARDKLMLAPAVSGAVPGGGLVLAQTGRFSDVAEGAYYSTPVAALAAASVFEGTECGPGLLCPDEPIDRKTMAVWTVRVVTGEYSPAVSESRYSDVDAGSFWRPFIERMAELGVTFGCGDGTVFCPDDTVTRAQMAVFLSRAFSLADGVDPGFSDVREGAWYGPDVARLAHSGITKGCGDGTVFCPEQDTTRAQMATFLHRALTRADNPSSDDGSVGPAEPDELADTLEGPQLSDAATLIDGDWTIPTFICAEEGKFTAGYLNSLVDQLNDELDGFFSRASSGRMSLVFTEGSVVSADVDWDDINNIPTIQRSCPSNYLAISPTPQVLLVYDTEFVVVIGRHKGYGRFGGEAAVLTPARFPSTERFLHAVVHELAHSVLRLAHFSGSWPYGALFINEWDIPSLLAEPMLACYQYELLGWVVPEYTQPCVRLGPSEPGSVSLSLIDDSQFSVHWEPPAFTDDAPVTGYIVRAYTDTGDLYIEYNTGADERSQTFAVSSVKPGLYQVHVIAKSRYGEGSPGVTIMDTAHMLLLPYGPVRITNVTNNSLWLAWDTESHKDLDMREHISLTYEVQYSANGITRHEKGWGNEQNSDTAIILRDLDQDTEYTIRVRACTEDAWLKNCTDWKTVTASTTSILPPPASVTVASGSDWYLLTWDPVPGAGSYLMELPDGRHLRVYTPDYGTNYAIEPNTTYALKVSSCSYGRFFCEEGEWSTVTVTTTAERTVPPPYRVSLKEIGDTWVAVLWDSLGGGSQAYRVEYEYTDGSTDSGPLEYEAGIGEPLRLEVEPNSTYTLRVRNCDPRHNGSCSTWTSFTFATHPVTSSVVPPSVRATEIGDIWLAASWDQVLGAISYDWRYKKTEDDFWREWHNTSIPFIYLSHGLEANTEYAVEVRSCGELIEPCSSWARTTLMTVGSLPSAPPSYPVSVEDVTNTEIHLVWNPPDRDQYYTFKWYPTEERGRTYVHTHTELALDNYAVLSELEPNTAYTIAVRACRWSGEDPCDDWVTINVTTDPRR